MSKKLTKEEFLDEVNLGAEVLNDEMIDLIGNFLNKNEERMPGLREIFYAKVKMGADEKKLDKAYAEYCEEFADKQ